MHDIAHTSQLAAALRAEVADVHPDHRLDQVLDRAHRRPPTWLVALALTVAVLLVAALLAHAHQQDAPVQPTNHTQEA
jgi:hypothetical protein